MNPTLTPSNRHTRTRQATLRQLAQLGPFVEGSLSPFKRPGCSRPGWHLTFKQKAKTRTVYVPMAMVPEVTSSSSAPSACARVGLTWKTPL